MQPFATTVTHHDNVCVLEASGEIDMDTSIQFAVALSRALAPGVTLVLDLSAVSFMDSQGLHAMLAAAHGAEAIGSRFSIVPSPTVSRVLELIGADLVLKIHHDRAEAIIAAYA